MSAVHVSSTHLNRRGPRSATSRTAAADPPLPSTTAEATGRAAPAELMQISFIPIKIIKDHGASRRERFMIIIQRHSCRHSPERFNRLPSNAINHTQLMSTRSWRAPAASSDRVCAEYMSEFLHDPPAFVVSKREWHYAGRQCMSWRKMFYHYRTSCIIRRHPDFDIAKVVVNLEL